MSRWWRDKRTGTHISKRVDGQGADGVSQQANAKDIQVADGDTEVPYEVAGGQRLHQAASTGVAPDAALPVHGLALLVGEHDPQSDDVDQDTLEERDNVGVPAGSFAPVRRVVGAGILAGDPRRDHQVDEGVEEGGGDDFVDVLGQHGHLVLVRVWLNPLAESGYRGYEEGVLHGCGGLCVGEESRR